MLPVEWQLPDRIESGEPIQGSVRVSGLDTAIEVTCWVTAADGSAYSVSAALDEDDFELWTFVVPREATSAFGPVQFAAEVLHGAHRTDYARSAPVTVPMVYGAELDITGVAAERLVYPLGGDSYAVRYIPCCNIYGGAVEARRLPENPHDVDEGLPEKIFGEFIVLEPDGLSASTMGLNLDIVYSKEATRAAGIQEIALYEMRFDNTWGEIISYDHDVEAGTISMHCPEGGTFVLAEKR